jgi:hypothetical protein
MTANSWVVSYCATLLVLTGNGAHAFAASATVDSAKAQILETLTTNLSNKSGNLISLKS